MQCTPELQTGLGHKRQLSPVAHIPVIQWKLSSSRDRDFHAFIITRLGHVASQVASLMSVDYKDRFRSHNNDSEQGTPNKKRFFHESDIEVTSDPAYETFKSNLVAVVGPQPDEKVRLLYLVTKNDITAAINRVLDNDLGAIPPSSETVDSTDDFEITEIRESSDGLLQSQSELSSQPVPSSTGSVVSNGASYAPEDTYFLGSFNATGWATRSGQGLLKYKEPVRLRKDRKKAARGTDFIVRIVNSQNVEVARISATDAPKLSALMEFDVCSFGGEVLYVEDKLKVGDDVFLAINCYLNPMVFKQQSNISFDDGQPKKKRLNFDNSRESDDERLMRMRQKALAEVFQIVNLVGYRDVSEAKGLEVMGEEEALSELSKDQLDAFYSRSGQSAEHTLQETEPPSSFTFELRPYQKRGLTWMINRERAADQESDDIMHPLWEKLVFPRSKIPFYVNLYSGELSLQFPKQRQSARGGILADEMGLGKTISTMALIHANSQPGSTTLLVVPMSLMSQWESEARACSKEGSIDIFLYYGTRASQFEDFMNNATGLRIVLTTYGTLAQDFIAHGNRTENTRLQLFDVTFDRVVLDEAHSIKNRATKSAKASHALQSNSKWALTGTPIINTLEDLYSLIKFLGIEPWSNFRFWRAFVTLPFQSKGYVQALNIVQSIVEPILLRRTKEMKQADGQPLVELPEKTVRIERVQFSEDEDTLYKFWRAQIKRRVVRELNERALASYPIIIALILRLRQICCHPSLIVSKDTSEDIDGISSFGSQECNESTNVGNDELEAIMSKFDSTKYGQEMFKTIGTEEQICPICTDTIEPAQLALTECGHVGCVECLMTHYRFHRQKGEVPHCSVCREVIQSDSIWQVVMEEPSNDGDGEDQRKVTLRKYKPLSAKLSALLVHLQRLPKGEKCVVFSQFTSFLDVIQDELVQRKFNILRFDGTLSQAKRKKVLTQFIEQKDSCILLLSLKAGGTGLNLVCARYAYLMDPWWSYAIEAQAIDRIHRMGQLNNVEVVRFIVEGSVEERMLKIQERKKLLAGSTLSMSDDERKQERLEEIRMLFED